LHGAAAEGDELEAVLKGEDACEVERGVLTEAEPGASDDAGFEGGGGPPLSSRACQQATEVV